MAARGVGDRKERALRASRTLNPCPQAVADEVFCASTFCDARDLVQVKYEMVRRVRIDKVPIAQAASAFGFSRQAYYQAAAALDAGGPAALIPGKPGPKGPRKLTEEVTAHLEALLEADASLRPIDLVAEVQRRFGIVVHRRSIERALARREAARAEGATKSRPRPT
jgi:transposase